MLHLRSHAVVSRHWPVLLLAVLPVLVHLPALSGWFRYDPLYVVSGLTAGTWHPNGVIGGYPGWIDGNAGVTTQALGALAARDWLAGVVPWWNPYSGVGLPLAGEGQTPALFLPFVLLLALPHGMLALRMLLMAFAGLSTLGLLRVMRLHTVPAFTGAALFELNGCFAWIGHGPMMPVAFLPMMLLGAEHARRGRWPLALVFGVAWTFLAGFPETAALNLLFVACWCACRMAQSPRPLAYAWRAFGAAAVGLMLAAPAIWAFLQALPYEFLGTHAGAVQSGLTPGNWALLIFPYLYGNIMQGPLFDGRLAVLWNSAGGYAGLALVALAVLALRRGAHDAALRWTLLAWLIVSALRAAAVPPAPWIFSFVPLLRQAMVHLYIVPSWCMALCVLAALTLQDWQDGVRLRFGIGACVISVFMVASLLAARPDLRLMAPILPAWLPIFAVAIPLASVMLAISLLHRPPHAQAAMAVLLVGGAVATAALPLLAGTHGRALDVGAIRYLQDNIGLGRVVSFGPMVPNYGAMFGVAEISHNYLPVPANWVQAVRARLLPDSDGVNFYQGAPPSSAAFQAALPHYQSMGVRYALTWPGVDLAAVAPSSIRVFRSATMDIWALPAPRTYADAAGCSVAGGRTVLQVLCANSSVLTRRELAFPGWTATINGVAAPVVTADIFQTVALPAGASRVVFTYAPPGTMWAWLLASLGALVTFMRVTQTDKSFLFLFFKKESAFFSEEKKQKTFIC